MIFWIGLYPAPFLNMINGSVQKLTERLEQGSGVKAVRFERVGKDAGQVRP